MQISRLKINSPPSSQSFEAMQISRIKINSPPSSQSSNNNTQTQLSNSGMQTRKNKQWDADAEEQTQSIIA
eukprot:10894377-Ditylum_brightwellii.AAC.1